MGVSLLGMGLILVAHLWVPPCLARRQAPAHIIGILLGNRGQAGVGMLKTTGTEQRGGKQSSNEEAQRFHDLAEWNAQHVHRAGWS